MAAEHIEQQLAIERQRINALESTVKTIRADLDSTIDKVGQHSEKLDSLHEIVVRVEDRMGRLEDRFGRVEDRIGRVEAKTDTILELLRILIDKFDAA